MSRRRPLLLLALASIGVALGTGNLSRRRVGEQAAGSLGA